MIRRLINRLLPAKDRESWGHVQLKSGKWVPNREPRS